MFKTIPRHLVLNACVAQALRHCENGREVATTQAAARCKIQRTVGFTCSFAASVAGGIIDKAMPLDQSNVMLYNPQTKKGDRVGIRFLEDGRKVRFFKSNNEVVDV